MKHYVGILKKTFQEYLEDEPFDLSAIVAYYSIFSLPALLLIVISSVGMAFGEEAVEGEITEQIGGILGKDAADQVQTMIANAYVQENTLMMTIIGIGILVFGATTVFLSLQRSLNRIWRVKPKKESGGIKKMALDRATSFGLILAIGFLILISLVLTAGLSALSDWLKDILPEMLYYVFYLIDFALSLSIITVLFSMMFKILPDVQLEWRSVWKGALVTAALFLIGKFGMGIYFGNSDPASTYGAAGSIVLLLLWINYSCLIMFLGAKFTKIYAEEMGHAPVPKPHAEWNTSF